MATKRGRLATLAAGAVAGALLLGVEAVGTPAAAAAERIPVSSCQTLGTPGNYVLMANLAVVDTTCIQIMASDVTLDLAGHTLSCTGSGYAGRCQVPEFKSHGVAIGPGLAGVTVKGPGEIAGFDNGIVITDSDVLVKGITITGVVDASAADFSRPVSNGVIVMGQSGVNLSQIDVSGHLFGLRLFGAQCPNTGADCVFNANIPHDNAFHGIAAASSTGYSMTNNIVHSNAWWGMVFSSTTKASFSRNVVYSNGSRAFFEMFHAGGIALGEGSNGVTIVNNDASNNVGWGIGLAPTTSGNNIANNTARGNYAHGSRSGIGDFDAADLMGFPGSTNTWNDNNRCHTSTGVVPDSVCNPGE